MEGDLKSLEKRIGIIGITASCSEHHHERCHGAQRKDHREQLRTLGSPHTSIGMG